MSQEPLDTSQFVQEVLGFYRGRLSRTPNYEDRPQQQALAVEISRAIEEGLVLLAEAGTGTGKSLAYLIPAVLWTRSRERPIIVSTRTLNLQQQLLEKDIPLLQSLFGEPFLAAPARGWSNYVCLRRLYDVRHQTGLEPEMVFEAEQLVSHLETGVKGIRQELQVSGTVWSEVCADSTACNRQQCPFFSQCYLFEERRQLEKADIIVTNHSLVLADLSLKRAGAPGILPRCQALVLDEAHHLEEVANEHLARAVSLLACDRLKQQLYRPKSRHEEGGFLPNLRQFVAKSSLESTQKQEILKKIDFELLSPLPDFYSNYENFFADLGGLGPTGPESGLSRSGANSLHSSENRGLRSPESGGNLSQRTALKPGSFSGEAGELVRERGARLAGQIDSLRSALVGLSNRLAEVGEDPAFAGYLSEVESIRTQLGNFKNDLEFCLFPEDPQWIYWLLQTKNDVQLGATPLNVGQVLREDLFHATRCTVMTSATLTSAGSFDFLRSRLGLLPESIPQGLSVDESALDFDFARVGEFCVDSPFDYRDQAYLGVARDLPTPNDSSFLDQVVAPLERLVVELGGRTFILLTSYTALRRLSDSLQASLELHGIELLCQGQAPNSHLLHRFRKDGRSVLLGTDSFWEGVDVPGEALQCVVLAKLPFRVPTDPIVEAHCRRLEENGQSAFGAYQLPQAILKLRQGFGRLIRTTSDRGLVYVLDSRLYHKNYGRDFLKSLPPCTRRAGPLDQLVEDGLRWLRRSSPT